MFDSNILFFFIQTSEQCKFRPISTAHKASSVIGAVLAAFSIACRRYSCEMLLVQTESSFCSMLFCDCSSMFTSRCNKSSCRCRLSQLPMMSEASNMSWTITERLICRFKCQPLVFRGVMIYLLKLSDLYCHSERNKVERRISTLLFYSNVSINNPAGH